MQIRRSPRRCWSFARFTRIRVTQHRRPLLGRHAIAHLEVIPLGVQEHSASTSLSRGSLVFLPVSALLLTLLSVILSFSTVLSNMLSSLWSGDPSFTTVLSSSIVIRISCVTSSFVSVRLGRGSGGVSGGGTGAPSPRSCHSSSSFRLRAVTQHHTILCRLLTSPC